MSLSGQVEKIPSILETTGQSIILSFVQNFKGDVCNGRIIEDKVCCLVLSDNTVSFKCHCCSWL